MADFGYLSDTDESAVEELISQAQDLTVLEQVSKINSSGFTHSPLPTELETRFRKLKSFPVSKPHATAATSVVRSSKSGFSNKSLDERRGDEESEIVSVRKQYPGGQLGSFKGEREIFSDNKDKLEGKLGIEKESLIGYAFSPLNSSNSWMREEIFSPEEENPDGNKGLKKKSEHGSVFSPSHSSNSWVENVISSPSKWKAEKKNSLKSNKKSGSFTSPLDSSNSFTDSPSPPQKTGCFLCYPKRDSKKKSKENWSLDWNNTNDEFLSDLGTFSMKEQQKILRQAMKEEEKINKEAEKIVKWAKQASARMSFHGIEDDLSDDEGGK